MAHFLILSGIKPYFYIMEKGTHNGKCNITACNTGKPAEWYNHSTCAFYCTPCAIKLNSDEFNKRDAQRLFGHNLCTFGSQKTQE